LLCSEQCYESHAVHMDPPDEEVCGECGREDCGCLWDDLVEDDYVDEQESERRYFDSGPYDRDF
jgi:hypothetical protein